MLFGKITGAKPTAGEVPTAGKPLAANGNKYLLERIVKWVLFLLASVSVLTTVGIVSVLLFEGVRFFTTDFYENNPVERIATGEVEGQDEAAPDSLAPERLPHSDAQVRIADPDYLVPGAVPEIRVSTTTDSLIYINWDQPTIGPPPTGYDVSVRFSSGLPDPNADHSDCQNLGLERTSCVIANAAPGRGYMAEVFAVAGSGRGAELQTKPFNVPESVKWHRFLTDTKWRPQLVPRFYGIFTLVVGTTMIAVLAMFIALPLGLISAIFLSEYAHPRLRSVTKPVLEVLAGIPTIVYGFFALMFITPLLRGVFGDAVGTTNAFSAAIVMGVMIVPMVSSLSEDAMRAVPNGLREGAYALGATKFEVATRIVVPAAFSGIVAAFILSMSRAIGETMIVYIAAGHDPNFSFLSPNPLGSVSTMTGYMVATNFSDNAIPGTAQFQALFAVGITLFIVTLIMNFISRIVVTKFREVYE